jgi:hypothetical protein
MVSYGIRCRYDIGVVLAVLAIIWPISGDLNTIRGSCC